MLVFSRLLKLLGILVPLALAFHPGSLDTNTMVFIGAALIGTGAMLPKVFAAGKSIGQLEVLGAEGEG